MMTDWKSIETAPKDGGRQLFWNPLWRCPMPGRICDGRDVLLEPDHALYVATHWIPLPEPPK